MLDIVRFGPLVRDIPEPAFLLDYFILFLDVIELPAGSITLHSYCEDCARIHSDEW